MRGLPLLVGVVFLLESVLYAVLPPLLPHYVDQFTLSGWTSGILTGSYTAGILISTAISSKLATAISPRGAMVTGLAVIAVASVVFGTSSSFVTLVIARAVQGIGGGLSWSGALTMVNTAARPQERGRILGLALGMVSAGTVLGPVVGVLGLAAGPALAFGIVALLCVGLAVSVPRHGGTILEPPARRLPCREMALPALLLGVLMLPFGLLSAILPLPLADGSLSRPVLAVTFVAVAMAAVGVSAAAGRFADRHGRIPVVSAALAVEVVILAIVPFGQSAVAGLALYAVFFGIVTSLAFVPAVALVTDVSERCGDRWGAPALVLAVSAFAETIGSVAGGALAASMSVAVPCALCGALNLMTLGFLRHRGRTASVRNSPDTTIVGTVRDSTA